MEVVIKATLSLSMIRDVKFVFFPNSNFVCKIRILFELRLGLRYIMVSSVHHYHGTQVPASDKNECVRLAMQSESTCAEDKRSI